MNFSNKTKRYLRRMCAALALVYGFILLVLWHYGELKNFTIPIIGRLGSKPSQLEFTLQWPDDSYLTSGVRGTKKPLESRPEDPHL